MKYVLRYLILVSFIGFSMPVVALTSTWTFDTSSEYYIADSSKIELSGGNAQAVSSLGPDIVATLSVFNPGYSVNDIVMSSDESVLYISEYEPFSSHLRSVDISTPTSPSTLDNDSVGVVSYLDISDDDDTVLIAGSTGVNVYDVSTPSSLSNVGFIGSNGHGVISSDGNTLYNTQGATGLRIYDVSGGYGLGASLLGTYNTTGSAKYVVISADENTAYVSDGASGLQIIDISTPASMSLIGTYDTTLSQQIAISADENTAYIADGSSGVHIVDISTPASPSLIATYDTSGFSHDVALSSDENTMYIADDSGGLLVLDISTPASPTLESSVSTTEARSILVSSDGDTLYLADGTGGLRVIDLTVTSYPDDSPYIETDRAYEMSTGGPLSFTESLGAENAGDIKYQLSTNSGSTWQYWNGSAWTVTTATDGTETSSASDINTNISSLSVGDSRLKIRAYLVSDGTEKVQLDTLNIEFPGRLSSGGGSSSVSREVLDSLSFETTPELETEDEVEVDTEESIETEEVTSSECNAGGLDQDLYIGDRDDRYSQRKNILINDVLGLQKVLNKLGFESGPEDGIFGPITFGAVVRAQNFFGIHTDGKVGPETRSKLTEVCDN